MSTSLCARVCSGRWWCSLLGARDLSDDSEAEGDFKSENDDTKVSDDAESPSKKAKTGGKGKVKVEVEDVEENGQFHDSGFETGFGGDGIGEMEEGMFA